MHEYLRIEVRELNDWYEQWSKAGAGPNFRVENPELYIKNFNWVKNWIDEYFFTKVSDFILGLVVLYITLIIFGPYSKNTIGLKIILVYLLLIIILFLSGSIIILL